MQIECWLNKVRDVRIMTKPVSFALTGPLAVTPVVEVGFERGEVDPFAAYYEASRQPRVVGPHHAFASITTEKAIAPFLKRFGFLRFEGGRPLPVAEVLIEAKRLRLLMEAWDAFRANDLSLARDRLGELNFALGFKAAWFYWPPPSLFLDRAEDHEALKIHRDLMEWEFERAAERAAAHATREQVRAALVAATSRTCVDPLAQVEFAPGIGIADADRLDVSWVLRPIRFLGESEVDGVGIPHEEAYIGAPYALMFLLDETEGFETRVCADKFCRRIFGAARRNQVYCTPNCAHRVAQRDYRERSRRGRKPGGGERE